MQVYEYPPKAELQQKVNYLSKQIKQPFNQNSDILAIGNENPEFMLFSLSFSTFALTNISFLDTSFRTQAIEIMDFAIQKALTDTIYRTYFPENTPFSPAMDTNISVLYYGHLNLMLGCYRLLAKNDKYNELNDKLSAHLYQQFKKTPYLCLASYPQQIWVPDNTVALASLHLHSKNSGSNYKEVCAQWVTYAKAHLLEKQTNLLYSTVDFESGEGLEEPRGCMLGWSIFFIQQFDATFAKELYENYKEKFSSNLLIFRLFNERYESWNTDLGDIDSGPVFLGYSIPANAFAFGDAVAMKDWKTAKQLRRLISFGSKTKISNNELKYATRFVDLRINPLSEALILYFETITPWE